MLGSVLELGRDIEDKSSTLSVFQVESEIGRGASNACCGITSLESASTGLTLKIYGGDSSRFCILEVCNRKSASYIDEKSELDGVINDVS